MMWSILVQLGSCYCALHSSTVVSPSREELASVEVGRAESRRGPELAQQVAEGAQGRQGGWERGTIMLYSTV